MDNKDQIIDKIRKLFRTARDAAATRGEVENALAAARRLMDKHALEENDIAEVAQADVNEAYESTARRSEGWLRELHVVIAYITETGAVSKKRPGCREAIFGFAGCKGDPFVALALFAEMATIARAFAKREARVCARSYLLGFVEGLMIASVRARKQALEDLQCTALVAKKSELIKTHLNEGFALAKRREVNVEELHQGDLSAGFRRGRDEGEKVKARGESA